VVLVSSQPLEAVQREEHGMQLFQLLDAVSDRVSPLDCISGRCPLEISGSQRLDLLFRSTC
jgi:hypothetical protein